MNTQEMFDKVVTHLLTQGERSINLGTVEDTCMYRGSDGLMCAVGCLITDEFYFESLEFQSVTAINVAEAVEESIRRELSIKEVNLLSQLQYIHDEISVDDWKEYLKKCADEFGLEFNYDAA